MLERKAYGEMRRWKAQDSGESALLLEGARRVGKSTIAEEFGRREYRSYALFDFSKVTRTFKDAFLDLRGDMDTLFMYLQTYVNVRLYEREPLVMFDEIPGQLSKHEKRFTLASLDKNARMREYAGSFFWLKDSGIANVCLNATDPTVGLAMSQDNSTLKCYMGDTGLLVAQTFADRASTPSEVYRDILLDKLAINEGMLVENAVAQQLRASGHELFFFSRSSDDKNKRMEIDFLVAREYDDAAGRLRVCPIEVKSGKGRYATSSLDKFRRAFGKRIGTDFVLHPKPLRRDGGRVYLPLYQAHLL